jgi:hypothetical protein
LAIYGDESTDESYLELLESDEEGQGLRFKSFRSEDIDNPIFKVGMIFKSVEMLRKAITQYSMKQRVEIKMPRNEKKRLKAHCADGCLWNLYASSDSRTQGLMIENLLWVAHLPKEVDVEEMYLKVACSYILRVL